jgi:hypothetical protein
MKPNFLRVDFESNLSDQLYSTFLPLHSAYLTHFDDIFIYPHVEKYSHCHCCFYTNFYQTNCSKCSDQFQFFDTIEVSHRNLKFWWVAHTTKISFYRLQLVIMLTSKLIFLISENISWILLDGIWLATKVAINHI